MSENWLSLAEFAVKRGISISTLRRYIRADRVRHRLENGRYLILDDPKTVALQRFGHHATGLVAEGKERIRRLETELKSARQEIAELKMLVALYEEKAV